MAIYSSNLPVNYLNKLNFHTPLNKLNFYTPLTNLKMASLAEFNIKSTFKGVEFNLEDLLGILKLSGKDKSIAAPSGLERPERKIYIHGHFDQDDDIVHSEILFSGIDKDSELQEVDGRPKTFIRGVAAALLLALQRLENLGERQATIYTEADFIMRCSSRYFAKWNRNGWRTIKGEPVKHEDLLRPASALLNRLRKAGYRIRIMQTSSKEAFLDLCHA